jgi:hypothetical protein
VRANTRARDRERFSAAVTPEPMQVAESFQRRIGPQTTVLAPAPSPGGPPTRGWSGVSRFDGEAAAAVARW